MSSEELAGWITAVGGALIGIAGATWGILQSIKTFRIKSAAAKVKTQTAENVADAELTHRIKMDSAEREKMRLEQEKIRLEQERMRLEQQADYYRGIIKDKDIQSRKIYERLGQVEAGLDKLRESHLECEKDRVVQHQRVFDQNRRIEQQDEQIAALQARLAALEERNNEKAAHRDSD